MCLFRAKSPSRKGVLVIEFTAFPLYRFAVKVAALMRSNPIINLSPIEPA